MSTPENPEGSSKFPELYVSPTDRQLSFSEGLAYGFGIAQRLHDLEQQNVRLNDEVARIRSERDYFEQLALEARTDELTGKPNRRALTSRLDELTEERPGEFGLLFVDLDGLKRVNDTEGHEAGNELIRRAADVLDDNLRTDREEPDTIARSAFRLSGDEFVVVLPGVTDSQQLETVARRLETDLEEQDIRASFGGALHEDSESAKTIIAKADQAMYDSKVQRRRAAQEAARQELSPEARQTTEEAIQMLGQIGMDVDDFYRLYGNRSR
ncbi:MAG TPA: GGDEF domain-containing protein [Candidatus Limnocylindrales bacterium]|nr:GGDEF domain-containing protein [Candidatus Limnocylindrales bacterium]